MAQLSARERESRYWATTLRRGAMVTTKQTTACAACNRELRAAAKALTDGGGTPNC